MMDLHVHTLHSDGACSVEEVLREAQRKNLAYLAICDHDTMDAWRNLAAPKIRRLFSGKILPACELTFSYQGMCMDMLAYGVDEQVLEDAGLLKHRLQDEVIARETKRLRQMCAVCDALHLHYPSVSIKAGYERANDVICDALLSDERNKAILEKLGIENRTTFYRNHYLNPCSPFYIKEEFDAPPLAVCMRAVKAAGGLCFLAHPFVYDVEDHEKLLHDLFLTGGWDGIECIHRRHSRAQSEWLSAYCKAHDLYQSGGSDYHLPKHDMGCGDNGNMEIMEDIAASWLACMEEKWR